MTLPVPHYVQVYRNIWLRSISFDRMIRSWYRLIKWKTNKSLNWMCSRAAPGKGGGGGGSGWGTTPYDFLLCVCLSAQKSVMYVDDHNTPTPMITTIFGTFFSFWLDKSVAPPPPLRFFFLQGWCSIQAFRHPLPNTMAPPSDVFILVSLQLKEC